MVTIIRNSDKEFESYMHVEKDTFFMIKKESSLNLNLYLTLQNF